ncbi:MAG: helix-turn-helix domain-containing protein [Proteobacteria bacterium]|nr:helix-turn-helix domain-containing protein [Pseudomonadota bacterium]
MIERHFPAALVCTLLGISRTTLWRQVRDGRLPPPIAISTRRRAWPESVIQAYLAARSGKAGAP